MCSAALPHIPIHLETWVGVHQSKCMRSMHGRPKGRRLVGQQNTCGRGIWQPPPQAKKMCGFSQRSSAVALISSCKSHPTKLVVRHRSGSNNWIAA